MPSNAKKGNHGTNDAGSDKRGNQKATYGIGVSPEVAEGQAEARMVDTGDTAGGFESETEASS